MKDHVGDHKIKSVDLYTSQNPCSVDTFTAKKVKNPPQSSSCTDSIFAYAKANPDVNNTIIDPCTEKHGIYKHHSFTRK